MLHVVYLVFNEGYSASSGDSLTRHDLSAEAIRLGRLLVELLPEPEAIGLLALMLLHESRREARTTADGELVLLDDQDRSRWNRAQIAEGWRWWSGRCASRQLRALHAAGGDRRGARRGADGRGDRLGARSWGCTTCCCGPSRRRWSSSTARPRWRCGTARTPGWR